jgi:hypothetical protein
MASAPDGPATEQGEYFLMALAERRAVSTLQDGDYIIVPLLTLGQGEVANPTFMATAPIMFLKLVGTPHAVMTYSVCAAFYGPVTIAPFALGDRVKLPSITTYFIARQGVVESLAELLLLSTSSVTQSSKRPCVRLLGELGEQPDSTSEKGTLKFVNDLDGGRNRELVDRISAVDGFDNLIALQLANSAVCVIGDNKSPAMRCPVYQV